MHCSLFNSPALLRWSHTLWWLKLILFYWEQEVMVRNISHVSVHRRYSYGLRPPPVLGTRALMQRWRRGSDSCIPSSLVRIHFGMWPSGERLTLAFLGVKRASTKQVSSVPRSNPAGSHVPEPAVRMGPAALAFCPLRFSLLSPADETASSCRATWISCLTWTLVTRHHCPPPRWMFNLRGILPQWPDLRQR